MNRQWAKAHYVTNVARDDREGWIAVELIQQNEASSERIARVVFWDADGQFSLEASTVAIPLNIVEELIAEAKQTIEVR